MLRPAKPRTAGSSVTDAAMTTSTASDHGEGEPVHGRLAHQQDAEHRDDDGHAGEQHRAAGGRDRGQRGPSRVLAVGQAAAEPGDDEQRVVDADADADHRRGVRAPSPGRRRPGAAPRRAPSRCRGRTAAVISGRPIATTDPKVMSRMMAAAIRPMPSEPTAAVWDLAATGPPTSTCRVSSPAARMGSTSALASLGGELVGRLVEGDVGVRGRAVRRDLAGTAVGERAGDAHDVLGCRRRRRGSSRRAPAPRAR